jgi:small subunit ribosomal protein S20
MASHSSAEKCIRKTARQTLVNKNRVSRIRTDVRKLERMLDAPQAQEKTAVQLALVAAERQLMRGVSKGMMHKNTAARKVSRLAKRVKAIA